MKRRVPKAARKDQLVQTRVPDNVMPLFKAAAMAEGRTLAGWMRWVLLQAVAADSKET